MSQRPCSVSLLARAGNLKCIRAVCSSTPRSSAATPLVRKPLMRAKKGRVASLERVGGRGVQTTGGDGSTGLLSKACVSQLWRQNTSWSMRSTRSIMWYSNLSVRRSSRAASAGLGRGRGRFEGKNPDVFAVENSSQRASIRMAPSKKMRGSQVSSRSPPPPR